MSIWALDITLTSQQYSFLGKVYITDGVNKVKKKKKSYETQINILRAELANLKIQSDDSIIRDSFKTLKEFKCEDYCLF